MKRRGRRLVRLLALAIFALYAAAFSGLLLLRSISPWTTGVQVQRRIESWFAKPRYEKRYRFVPLRQISPHLQHAVIAAEDGRFYTHHGFDWEQLEQAIEEKREGGRLRGASTITQQTVKNLFLTTRGSFGRKAIETTLTPLAELALSKNRILELYLNIAEWGPGVYGAEAAAQFHFHIPASKLTREQAARLAAILPAPRRRRPARMDDYSNIIQERMRQHGW